MKMTYKEMFEDNYDGLLEMVGTNQPLRTGKQYLEVEFKGCDADLNEECESLGREVYNSDGNLVYRQHRVGQ